MRADLGVSDEAKLRNRGHFDDIAVFEKEIKIKLRTKLLSPAQYHQLESMQCPTLSELRSLVNERNYAESDGRQFPHQPHHYVSEQRDSSSSIVT